MKMVELELARPRFFGNFEDIDEEQEVRGKTLSLPEVVWLKATGLAETQGFRAGNTRSLMPAQTKDLAERLRVALAEKPVALRRASNMTAKSQLLEFFSVPTNAKQAQKLLAYIDQGGTLNVE